MRTSSFQLPLWCSERTFDRFMLRGRLPARSYDLTHSDLRRLKRIRDRPNCGGADRLAAGVSPQVTRSLSLATMGFCVEGKSVIETIRRKHLEPKCHGEEKYLRPDERA
jgi:hypothetical protein